MKHNNTPLFFVNEMHNFQIQKSLFRDLTLRRNLITCMPKKREIITQKENCKAVGRNLVFVQYQCQQLARVKTAGCPFVVVWGTEQTSDYSFSTVVAVSVLVWFCTPLQQMLQPPLKWIVINSYCAALTLPIFKLKEGGPQGPYGTCCWLLLSQLSFGFPGVV